MPLQADSPSAPRGTPKKTPTPSDAPASKTAAALVCAACEHPITDRRFAIAMSGRHEHRFMNPAGYLYHVGCFAEAIGCVVVGPASSEYAWFPGFDWRCAHCGGCGQQLGWQFRARAGGAGFYGLILDRLREADASSAPPSK